LIETGESAAVPALRTLGDDHPSVTHRFRAGETEGLFVVGLFDDGAPGEVLFVPRKSAPGVSEKLNLLTEVLNSTLPHGVPPGPLAHKLAALIGESDAAPAAQHLAAHLTEKFSER
jgi:hypothetical protein